MYLLRLIKKMADGLVVVESIDYVCNVLAHVNLGVPGTGKKLGSPVNKVGCENTGDCYTTLKRHRENPKN